MDVSNDCLFDKITKPVIYENHPRPSESSFLFLTFWISDPWLALLGIRLRNPGDGPVDIQNVGNEHKLTDMPTQGS